MSTFNHVVYCVDIPLLTFLYYLMRCVLFSIHLFFYIYYYYFARFYSGTSCSSGVIVSYQITQNHLGSRTCLVTSCLAYTGNNINYYQFQQTTCQPARGALSGYIQELISYSVRGVSCLFICLLASFCYCILHYHLLLLSLVFAGKCMSWNVNRNFSDSIGRM